MIYHIIENTCYQSLTNGLAIPELAKRLKRRCISYSINDFCSGNTKIDNNQDAIFITESAFLRNGKTLKDVRKLIPNGKIINMGSDSILFTRKGLDEIEYVEEVDLWLDTMPEVVDYYSNKGMLCDWWDWTISEVYIRQIEKYQYNQKKEMDFVCLAHKNSDYRRRLRLWQLTSGIKAVWGNGNISSELPYLGQLYNMCWVALGTTSPAGADDIRTMKGFRDWIAPFFGTILISDDHPKMMAEHSIVIPWTKLVYKYDDFESIKTVIDRIRNFEQAEYNYYLSIQKAHISNRTIESQLQKLFIKHEII